MSSFGSVLVGSILPYLTVAVFLGGMGYRFYVWKKTPQPGKMTLFPADTPGSNAGKIVAEALLFPSLFKGDKSLWAISWVFHATLGLVFLGHVRVFSGVADRILLGAGLSTDHIAAMSGNVGGAAGVVLVATAALLVIRRLTVKRAREISLPSDFFALLLVLAIVISGNLMRFGTHFDLEQTRAWGLSLLTFAPQVPTDPTFLWHAMLAQLLIMFMPFSKLLHFGGIFFTQALIKRR